MGDVRRGGRKQTGDPAIQEARQGTTGLLDASYAMPSETLLMERLAAARMQLARMQARGSLLAFTRLMMPDPAAPDDPSRSLYEAEPFHEKLAADLEWLADTPGARLVINCPPRTGKSELASRQFPVWLIGRNPRSEILFATYSAEFAEEFGATWRATLRSPEYKAIFPGVELMPGSQSKSIIGTVSGGKLYAVGVGGPLTGRGANYLIIDDPFKDSAEADSPVVREARWSWFKKVAFTRLMPGGRVVIIMTRWHDDDLVGRLFNPAYVPRERSEKWRVAIHKAIGDDGKPLCPKRRSLEELLETRDLLGARDWSALYQQSPAPTEGLFFKRDDIVPYMPHELPNALAIYCVSDHALTAKQTANKTCMLAFGQDSEDNTWILPDCHWGAYETDETLERMIAMMKKVKPIMWFAEDEHINKALGPFRRREMRRHNVYVPVVPMRPSKDIFARAQSIRGRIGLRTVRFPVFASWWGEAEAELLKFPAAANDDFVSALSLIGLALDSVMAVSLPAEKKVVHMNTWGAFKKRMRDMEEYERARQGARMP